MSKFLLADKVPYSLSSVGKIVPRFAIRTTGAKEINSSVAAQA